MSTCGVKQAGTIGLPSGPRSCIDTDALVALRVLQSWLWRALRSADALHSGISSVNSNRLPVPWQPCQCDLSLSRECGSSSASSLLGLGLKVIVYEALSY
jgi:hypothetical protein